MKVYYHEGENWRWTPSKLDSENNILALSFNNWDDYTVKTTLNAALYFEGEKLLDFSLKLFVEESVNSPALLNELRKNGWDGFFPIPNIKYVSVPSDIDFYKILLTKLGKQDAITVLRLIKDAGYLANVVQDQEAIKLVEHEDFTSSPLREGGARKAFEDGWRLFDNQTSNIQDFTMNIRMADETQESIAFHFNSVNLPYDINVLIGPNGIGKSFTLKSLVEYWLGVESGSKTSLENFKHTPFDHYPNISKLILISYSPFEEFTLDLSKTDLKDKDAYKYFGFRNLRTNSDGLDSIGISRNLPARDSVASIIRALSEDKTLGFIQDWEGKFEAINTVLMPAIGFDSIALELLNNESQINPIKDTLQLIEENGKRYLPINNSVFETLQDSMHDLENIVNSQSGVLFFREGKKIEISSGQRLFSYIVINVVGQIKKDSLVVIDEPELFLHPTLEIEFISLLKKVLFNFNSKAILATHSLAIAREIPAKCIHVYRKNHDKVEIDHPPFETFGSDMQRISSYVFGDSSVSKPFDSWIEGKLNEVRDSRTLIQSLGAEINEEMIIKILNSGYENGN
ncbi:AAA family ATPase [Methylotenera sp. N17]|uniref:AAA family ATPase n=1 Tax=Methylotenera sp. N17 TaxID=1502761 RepID=UPI0006486AD6|nr:AAA family ATPase [Methylotenera sp. N17]